MGRPFQKIMLKLSGEALGKGTSEKPASDCNFHALATNASSLLAVSSSDTASSRVQRFRSKHENFVTKSGFSEVPKEGAVGIDSSALSRTVSEVKKSQKSGRFIAITVGGGNMWRYRDSLAFPLERSDSDYLGMLATLFNALCLRAEFEKQGVAAYACSRVSAPKVIDDYDRKAVLKKWHNGEVVILAGGTGNPYFTTDSSSALSALELGCDILLKATKVPYVYDRDPVRYPGAKSFRSLSYSEVLTKKYQVMDATAISLCQSAKIPIRVFDFFKNGNLKKLCEGEGIGTIIS